MSGQHKPGMSERRRSGPTIGARIARIVGIAWQWVTGSGRAYSFRRRRIVAVLAVMLALAITHTIAVAVDQALLHRGVMTGWVLMACLVGLVLIGVRRRIPILPLGSMSVWTQVHLYTGAFSIGVFCLHAPMMLRGDRWIADGVLEGTLSVLFWLVSGSGVYGLIASRRLPRRLTAVGTQVRFDQVGWHREQLVDAAESEIDSLSSPAATDVLGEFHHRYLRRYFARGPSWMYLLVPTSVPRRRLLAGLIELNRYLEKDDQKVTGKLAALIRRRDDLDYQFALQMRLRVWVMVHCAASIALLVLAILHGIYSLRFVES